MSCMSLPSVAWLMRLPEPVTVMAGAARTIHEVPRPRTRAHRPDPVRQCTNRRAPGPKFMNSQGYLQKTVMMN
jgi:hypothetical protein